MTRDKIDELARLANIDLEQHVSLSRESVWIATPDELAAFTALVLEEAAKVCDVTPPQQAAQQEPAGNHVAHLYIGGTCGNELQDWEIYAEQGVVDQLNEAAYKQGKELKLSLYTHPASPLTDEQIDALFDPRNGAMQGLDEIARRFARAIEAAHKIGGAE